MIADSGSVNAALLLKGSPMETDQIYQTIRTRYATVADQPVGQFNYVVGRSSAEHLDYPSDLLELSPQAWSIGSLALAILSRSVSPMPVAALLMSDAGQVSIPKLRRTSLGRRVKLPGSICALKCSPLQLSLIHI